MGTSNIRDKNIKEFSNLQGVLLWEKNKESVYTWCNKEFYKKFGFKAADEIIGFSDYHLKCKASILAPNFQALDRKATSTGRSLRLLEVLKIKNNKWSMMLVDKIPLCINTKEFKGIFGHAVDLTNLFFPLCYALEFRKPNKKITLAQRSYLIINKNSALLPLDYIQLEIIFFLLRNKTNEEISFLLNIESIIIEKKIEELYVVFNCKTKLELICLLEEKDFFNFIPETIFNNKFLI